MIMSFTERQVDKLLFLLVTYPLGGIPLGIFHWLWRLLGLLVIEGKENFPKWPEKILVASNHPSKTLQPILTVGLFFPDYLWRPFKYGPYSVADKKNFYDRWFIRPVRCRIIPVDRNISRDYTSIKIMKEVAESGGNIIIFPEGGRTWSNDKFVYVSEQGNVMRQFKSGAAWIASEHNYTIIPIWCETHGIRVRFVIGKPILNLGGLPRDEVTAMTTQALFELADSTFGPVK